MRDKRSAGHEPASAPAPVFLREAAGVAAKRTIPSLRDRETEIQDRESSIDSHTVETPIKAPGTFLLDDRLNGTTVEEQEINGAVSPYQHKPGKADSRKLVKTSTPGIYRRRNPDGALGSYVVIYRAGGKQRKEHAKTLAEARAVKAARTADAARGEFQERTTIKLREFVSDWVERYQGTGRRGFREGTREEYRRLLDSYAHRYFSEKLRLVDVTPHALAQFVAWLADPNKQGRKGARRRVDPKHRHPRPGGSCDRSARRDHQEQSGAGPRSAASAHGRRGRRRGRQGAQPRSARRSAVDGAREIFASGRAGRIDRLANLRGDRATAQASALGWRAPASEGPQSDREASHRASEDAPWKAQRSGLPAACV